MSGLLTLPLLIPLLTAAALMVLRTRRYAQRVLSVLGASVLLLAAVALLHVVWQRGIQVVEVGDWPAPFGIVLVADLFGAVMVVLAALIGAMVTIYSLAGIDAGREAAGYHPLLHAMLLGVCGAFITGDLFNLYVWFEVMVVSSFALLSLGGERAQIEGSIKYVVLNLMSSALFLAALGILYGQLGTLNMADVARAAATIPTGRSTTVAMLFLVAFGIKAAVFPLFFWLPASYHTPPVPVSAIFAGLLTKVAVYAMIRVFTLVFVHDIRYTHSLILAVGAATMVTGVLGAAAQGEMRRILSFHIVSQIGYMVMGLGLYTRLAIAGAIFFIIHNIVVKTALFLVSGIVCRRSGSYELRELGGLYRASPGMAALFALPALSLAGIPPLSGFWGKLVLVRAGLLVGQNAVVATSLVVSMLTLYSMHKIWTEVFWKDAPERDSPAPEPIGAGALTGRHAPELTAGFARGHDDAALVLPTLILVVLSVILGLAAEPVFRLSARAAEQLVSRDDYLRAVLGGGY